jgi:hypothetical protein
VSSGRIVGVLTTGWEPDTPVADTLLRRFVFALAESWEPTVAAMGGRVQRCAEFALTDFGRPAGFGNTVTLLQPLPPGDADRADAVLDEIEASVGGGSGVVYLMSAWPTPDLRARGWELAGHPPFHLRPPAPLPVAPLPGGLRIAPMVDAAGVRDVDRVLVDGYPFADLQPWRPGALFDERVLAAEGPHLEVGYLDGQAVTVGARHVAHGLVVLVLGVTLPEARHRGCWAAMVRSRLAAAPDLPAVALFSDDSRPGAERLFGFLPITRFTLWFRERT